MEAQQELLTAIQTGDSRVVEELLRRDPSLADTQGANGVSAVLLAMYYQHPGIAQQLIAAGAEIDIFEAAAAGQYSRVVELVEGDPSLVNAFAPDGFQPLGLAAFFGNLSIVQYLLEAGAEVNKPAQNDLKVTPLHSAVAGGSEEVILTLLARDADPNVVQAGGFTPLHGAAQNGQLRIVQALVEAGAVPNALTEDGQLPVQIAEGKGHTEVSAYLQEYAGGA
jgi:uncharacterized protein